MKAPRWSVIGHILRPQGRKGEVLADLLTDFPERFEAGRSLLLLKPGSAADGPGSRTVTVASFWLPSGRNRGRIVLHFAGFDSINECEVLGGLDVLIPESDRRELDEETSYVSDLVGCTLIDQSPHGGPHTVGAVTEVQFPTNVDGNRLDEAAPLLVVSSPAGEEVLIPFVKAFLLSIDVAAKQITMSLPAGLVDVNRSTKESAS